MPCVGSSGLPGAFTPDMQQADTSSATLKLSRVVISEHYPALVVINYPFALWLFSLRSQLMFFFFLLSHIIWLHILHHSSEPLVHLLSCLPSICDTFHFPSTVHFRPSCFFFFCLSSQIGVGGEGTHQVNIRQTSVLMSITTWLNMAEWVRWIALWRSFCRGTDTDSCVKKNDKPAKRQWWQDVK